MAPARSGTWRRESRRWSPARTPGVGHPAAGGQGCRRGCTAEQRKRVGRVPLSQEVGHAATAFCHALTEGEGVEQGGETWFEAGYGAAIRPSGTTY